MSEWLACFRVRPDGTWVKSQWKLLTLPGHFSAEINIDTLNYMENQLREQIKTLALRACKIQPERAWPKSNN
jgi:hypothetical protein